MNSIELENASKAEKESPPMRVILYKENNAGGELWLTVKDASTHANLGSGTFSLDGLKAKGEPDGVVRHLSNYIILSKIRSLNDLENYTIDLETSDLKNRKNQNKYYRAVFEL